MPTNRIVESASQMFNNSASSSPALYGTPRTASKENDDPLRINIAVPDTKNTTTK